MRAFQVIGLLFILVVSFSIMLYSSLYTSKYPYLYRQDLGYSTLDALGYISTPLELKKDLSIPDETLIDTIVISYENTDRNTAKLALEYALDNFPLDMQFNLKIIGEGKLFLEEGSEIPVFKDVVTVRKPISTRNGNILILLSLW
ncbi:MAG: hypothetical protein ACE5K4_03015 [Candidatus Hydrothermarchaeota archaeon]